MISLFEIEFFEKADGTAPVKEFLEGLDIKMRAKSGNNISRVLYFFVIGETAVLTNGFIKKTTKTPKNEIERAKQYRADYLNRKEHSHDEL